MAAIVIDSTGQMPVFEAPTGAKKGVTGQVAYTLQLERRDFPQARLPVASCVSFG